MVENVEGDVGAGLGVGEGVVVGVERETEVGRDGVEFVVGQVGEVSPCEAEGAVEWIVGVGHVVDFVNRPQAAFVEGAVVCDQGQTLQAVGDSSPDLGEHLHLCRIQIGIAIFVCPPPRDRPLRRVPVGNTVDGGRPPAVEIRGGADEFVEAIRDVTVRDNDDPDATDTAAVLVGGLEIYGGEGVHSITLSQTGMSVLP